MKLTKFIIGFLTQIWFKLQNEFLSFIFNTDFFGPCWWARSTTISNYPISQRFQQLFWIRWTLPDHLNDRFCPTKPSKGLTKRGWFDNRETEWEDSFFLKQIRLVLIQKLKDFFKSSQKRLASRFQKKWTSQRTGNSSSWSLLRCSGNWTILELTVNNTPYGPIWYSLYCIAYIYLIQKTNFLKSRPQFGR